MINLPAKPKLRAKVARRSLCVGSKPLLQSRCNRSQIAIYFTLQRLALSTSTAAREWKTYRRTAED